MFCLDNASSDAGVDVIKNFQGRFSNLALFCERKVGVVNALNMGLREVSAGWVARMDADDIWLPGRHQFI